jgi:lipopolysaccharide export system permease protein
MSRVTRYILRQLTAPMLFITLALTGVIWLTQSLQFIDKIVVNGLSVMAFLQFTSLMLPRMLAVVLPIALFLSVVFTYHRLLADSEIVVLSAAGLSKFMLTKPVLIFASIVILVTYGIIMFVSPYSYRVFKDQQHRLRSDFAAVLLQEGTFNNLTHGLTVYVRERESNGELLGILVHDNRDTSQPVTMMAERGALVSGPDGPKFVMYNGNRQQVDRASGNLSFLTFKRFPLDLSQFIEEPGVRWRSPGERYLSELFNPGTSPDDIANKDKLWVEGHRRIVAPLYTLVLALIALTPILAGEFSRRGVTKQLLAAAAGALLFEALALGLTTLASKNPVLVPLMYLYLLVSLAAVIYVLARSPQRNGRRSLIGAR